MSQWISVDERLPESGVPVIVFVAGTYDNKPRRLRASYAAHHTLELGDDQEPWGDDCYDEATDAYYCPEGWYEHNEYEETHWHIGGTVTHWMPLPPPPSEPCTCVYSHEGDMDTIVRHNPACPAHGSGQAKQGGTGIAGVAE